MTPGEFWRVVILLILIPLVVYRGLKLWLEGDMSRFPDLDFAWRAGLTALRAQWAGYHHRARVSDSRHFGRTAGAGVVRLGGLALRVRAVPEGPAPLHWYANPEAIFVCCTEASWTSALAAYEATRPLTEMAAILSNLESSAAPAVRRAPLVLRHRRDAACGTPTNPPPFALPAPPRPALPAPVPAGGGEENIRGTIMLGQYAANLAAQAPQPPCNSTHPPPQQYASASNMPQQFQCAPASPRAPTTRRGSRER